MSLLVAYWHKEGLEIYRYGNNKPVRQAFGALDQLPPVHGAFRKKVLVVGRELLFHQRKRYPPAPKEKLVKALGLEIKGLFPLSDPAFHCQIYESSPTHTTLEIWAWDRGAYAQLKKVFPFDYVIPEDLCFAAEVPEVRIFRFRGLTHVLAHAGGRFLDGASYPAEENAGEIPLERFLQGIGRHREGIKRIVFYGEGPFPFKIPEGGEVSRAAERDYPLCLDSLPRIDLKEYKEKREFHFGVRKDLLFRVAIYLILGYGLVLYAVAEKYDRAIEESRKKTKGIEERIKVKAPQGKTGDYSEVVGEINERLKTRPSPLKVMNAIAAKLPAESTVNRMVLKENNVELVVVAKDPIAVVKALGSGESIKNVRLKGSPAKPSAGDVYNFTLVVELAR
ncbi:MAG: putative rane protein [Deltaproteobacteria bacterium]|jgi:hypothetical protein|nr:putative rane protein [Deltaproteobacteria bacterium]MBP1718492.1 putative rane protein [Deltaproteobacteria bacterium]